jgi:hypothetical protein
MKTVPCKGCGRPIVWAKDEKGTRHPLDPRAPVYHFNGGDLEGEFEVHRLPSAWVSHFATCPKASEFGKGKKRAPDTAALHADADREMGIERPPGHQP